MKWSRIRNLDRGEVALFVTIFSFLLFFFIACSWSWFAYQSYAHDLQDLNPRIARQLGVLQAKETLEGSVNQVKADILHDAFPVDKSTNEVNAELQQRVRQVFEGSGMITQGTQSLSTVDMEGYQVVSVALNAQGSMQSLTKALEKLSLEIPLITIDRMVLQPYRSTKKGGETEQVVRIELKASVVRLTK